MLRRLVLTTLPGYPSIVNARIQDMNQAGRRASFHSDATEVRRPLAVQHHHDVGRQADLDVELGVASTGDLASPRTVASMISWGCTSAYVIVPPPSAKHLIRLPREPRPRGPRMPPGERRVPRAFRKARTNKSKVRCALGTDLRGTATKADRD